MSDILLYLALRLEFHRKMKRMIKRLALALSLLAGCLFLFVQVVHNMAGSLAAGAH